MLRLGTNWYIQAAFRGIDEGLLTDREIDRIRVTEEERDRIARPFAEFANKNRFTRKHGRMLIATGGIADSVIALGMWVTRVNRIAAKYRRAGRPANASPRQAQPTNGNLPGYAQPAGYYSAGG